MKLTNINQVNEFLGVVDSCRGNVYLTTPTGKKYSFKSEMERYSAVAALTSDDAENQELWCDNIEDEYKLLGYYTAHRMAA